MSRKDSSRRKPVRQEGASDEPKLGVKGGDELDTEGITRNDLKDLHDNARDEVSSERESKNVGGGAGDSGDRPPKGAWSPDPPLWYPEADYSTLRKTQDGVLIPSHLEQVQSLPLWMAPDPGPRKWLVDGLMEQGYSASIYGAAGVSKSLLAMSLSVSLTWGQGYWLGMKAEQAPVLYLDFELGVDEQKRRVECLCHGEGYNKLPTELYYMSARGASSDSAFWSAYKICDEAAVKLLVVDSFVFAMDGEVNSNTDVRKFYREKIQPFEEEGIAVLLVDHMPKMGPDARYSNGTRVGAMFKRAAARSELQLEPLGQDDSTGTISVLARHTKMNNAPMVAPFGIDVQFVLQSGEIRVQRQELGAEQNAKEDSFNPTERIMFALDVVGEGTAKEMSDLTELSQKTCSSLLLKLEARSRVREVRLKRNTPVYEAVGGGPSPVRYEDNDEF